MVTPMVTRLGGSCILLIPPRARERENILQISVPLQDDRFGVSERPFDNSRFSPTCGPSVTRRFAAPARLPANKPATRSAVVSWTRCAASA
jgi:hypothetical protein